MGIKGKLTKDMMASNMPVDAPTYFTKPYVGRAHWFRFDYITDPEKASKSVPCQLNFTDTPSATLIFSFYERSTLGPYGEVVLGINTKYKDEDMLYVPYLYLDEVAPIVAGREIWGYPKKMAYIEKSQSYDMWSMFVERPKGIRLASAVFTESEILSPIPDGTVMKIASLKAIPNVEDNKKFGMLKLLEQHLTVSNVKMWGGPGNCHITDISSLDPLYKVPVVEMIGATHLYFDFSISHGKVLKNLLEDNDD